MSCVRITMIIVYLAKAFTTITGTFAGVITICTGSVFVGIVVFAIFKHFIDKHIMFLQINMLLML